MLNLSWKADSQNIDKRQERSILGHVSRSQLEWEMRQKISDSPCSAYHIIALAPYDQNNRFCFFRRSLEVTRAVYESSHRFN